MLPSLAVGSVMMGVGPMLSVMVVVILLALLVVEEAASGKSSGSVINTNARCKTSKNGFE